MEDQIAGCNGEDKSYGSYGSYRTYPLPKAGVEEKGRSPMADAVDKKIDPFWAWDAYKPSDKAPWDARRAGHMYRRAAFGPTAADLDRAVKDGPEKTIADLLKGGPGQEEYDKVSQQMARSIADSNNGVQLRAWWLHRMLYSPHPLQEKLTL